MDQGTEEDIRASLCHMQLTYAMDANLLPRACLNRLGCKHCRFVCLGIADCYRAWEPGGQASLREMTSLQALLVV